MAAGLKLYSFPNADFGIVVIIGRPGAGKSFLCESLLDAPGWKAAPGSGEPGRRWLTPLTMILRPVVSALAFAAAAARPPLHFRRYRQVVRVIRKYDAVKRMKGPGVIVVDEGPVHALLNVFFWSSSTAASRFFTRQLIRVFARRPDVFVYVDICPETSLANTKRRGHTTSWFYRDMSEHVAERLVNDKCYEEIVDTLKAVAPEKVRAFSSVPEALKFLTAWPQSARDGNVKRTSRPSSLATR